MSNKSDSKADMFQNRLFALYDTFKKEYRFRKPECADVLADFSESIGCKRSTVGTWLSGKIEPKYSQLSKIVSSGTCDAGYLFGEYAEVKRERSDLCKATGLSEDAVNALMKADKKTINGLQALLTSGLEDVVLSDLNDAIEYRAKTELLRNGFADSEISLFLNSRQAAHSLKNADADLLHKRDLAANKCDIDAAAIQKKVENDLLHIIESQADKLSAKAAAEQKEKTASE